MKQRLILAAMGCCGLATVAMADIADDQVAAFHGLQDCVNTASLEWSEAADGPPMENFEQEVRKRCQAQLDRVTQSVMASFPGNPAQGKASAGNYIAEIMNSETNVYIQRKAGALQRKANSRR